MGLPSICNVTSLKILFDESCAPWELPASIDALTALHTLRLNFLQQLKALLASIGALTVLKDLILYGCAFTDVPLSIESLIALLTPTLAMPAETCQDCRAFQMLPCALPARKAM